MFSFVVCNYSHKNQNRGQKLKYSKMTCEKMEDYIKFFNFNLLQKWNLTNENVKLKLNLSF